MKIGILTFHCAHNYGAMLQAYALVTALNNAGHDAEVIDYRLPKLYDYLEKYSFWGYFQHYRRRKQGYVISLLKVIKNYNKNQRKTMQWYRFEFFLDNYIKKSPRILDSSTISQLDYEAIICGSDQIWNPKLTDGYFTPYFAEINNKLIRKIAYAGSNGESSVSASEKDYFFSLIKNFNFLSTRETGLCSFFNKNKINCTNVLDPVFLLEKKEWQSIGIRPKDNGYILTYSFWEPDNFFEIAKHLAKKLNKKLIALSFSKKNYLNTDIIQEENAGPLELLGYLQNADYIITNSFHGTALSIILEKQFCCIPPIKHRDRIDSIMKIAGLEDHKISSIEEVKFLSNINYDAVKKSLQQAKATSFEFLERALKNG